VDGFAVFLGSFDRVNSGEIFELPEDFYMRKMEMMIEILVDQVCEKLVVSSVQNDFRVGRGFVYRGILVVGSETPSQSKLTEALC